MKRHLFLWISVSILLFAIFFQFFRLPFMQGDSWMSPDETANVYSAISLAQNQTVLISRDILIDFPWAYPRSFVFIPEAEAIAPVGFLGMPIVLSLIYKLFGLIGIWLFAPLLVALTAIPFWKVLPKTWPRPVKLMTLIAWLTFPTIILYSNRGVFPQITITCLAIWIWWLLAFYRNFLSYFCAGLFFGLALTIRPPEIIWLLPVVVFAFLHNSLGEPTQKQSNSIVGKKLFGFSGRFIFLVSLFLFGTVLFTSAGAYLGKQTYGKWLASGYQIRNVASVDGQDTERKTDLKTEKLSILQTLPFSFHPKNIFWNFKNYLLNFYWPYSLILAFALIILIKERAWRSADRYALAALIWSFAALVIFYGNGLYQDHVKLNQISSGNSFLRYIMPVSVVFVLAAGFVLNKLWNKWTLKIFAVCLFTVLLIFGEWTAFVRDDEGIQANEQELVRYQQIRQNAKDIFPDGAIILSDRSDKIFFPSFDAVSPMPDSGKIIELLEKGHDVALFLQTQNADGIQKWNNEGLLLYEMFSNKNQTLYAVDAYSLGNGVDYGEIFPNPSEIDYENLPIDAEFTEEEWNEALSNIQDEEEKE